MTLKKGASLSSSHIIHALLLCVTLFPTLAFGVSTQDYQELVSKRTLFWESIIKKTQLGDKSYCSPTDRKNLGTCARSFVLSQQIETATEMTDVAQVLLYAAKTDITERAMDEATITIYATESFVLFAQKIRYENPVCPAATTACEHERNALKEINRIFISAVEMNLKDIEQLRKKNPAQASTESWRNEKIKFIRSHYKESFSSFLEPRFTKLPKKMEAVPATSPPADSLTYAVAEVSQRFQKVYRSTFACFKTSDAESLEQIKKAVRPCLAPLDKTSADEKGRCINKKISQLLVNRVERSPTNQKNLLIKCIDAAAVSKAQ